MLPKSKEQEYLERFNQASIEGKLERFEEAIGMKFNINNLVYNGGSFDYYVEGKHVAQLPVIRIKFNYRVPFIIF